jgi:hypothetical protein
MGNQHQDLDGPASVADGIPFDRLPPGMTLRAFGVSYAHVRTAEGGDLYLTRAGWPFLRQLLPENWHTGG